MQADKFVVMMRIRKPDDEGNVDFIRDRAARELGKQLVNDILANGAAFVEVEQSMETPLSHGEPLDGTSLRLVARFVRGGKTPDA